MWDIIINSLFLVIPAYSANFFPVLLKGEKPIDFGKKFIDKEYILGKGKTFEGTIGGTLFGMFIGTILIYVYPILNPYYLVTFGTNMYHHNFVTIFLISFGAILGDIIGSFIKRRFGIKRGESAPLLDQLDFLVVSLMLVSLVSEIKLSWVVFLIIITPIFHLTSNLVAFILKLKNRPW